jgi:hypothetical protein
MVCGRPGRLPKAIKEVIAVKAIESFNQKHQKSFNRSDVEFAFQNNILWTRVDLRGCDKVRDSAKQEQESVREDLTSHPRS